LINHGILKETDIFLPITGCLAIIPLREIFKGIRRPKALLFAANRSAPEVRWLDTAVAERVTR
jgi:hypothetical protein